MFFYPYVVDKLYRYYRYSILLYETMPSISDTHGHLACNYTK